MLTSDTINGQLMSSQEFIQQNCSQLQSFQIEDKVNELPNALTQTIGQNDELTQIPNTTDHLDKHLNQRSDQQKQVVKQNVEKEKIAVKGLLKLSKTNNRKRALNKKELDRNPNSIQKRIALKRERNRIAAKKCRQKKLQLIETLEKRKLSLIEENKQMEQNLKKCRSEVFETKLFLLRHRVNDCKLIKR